MGMLRRIIYRLGQWLEEKATPRTLRHWDFYLPTSAYSAVGAISRVRRKNFNLDPTALTVLRALIKASRPKNVLEIGTSTGLTAVHVACDLPPGALFTTIEFDRNRHETAVRVLRNAVGEENMGGTRLVCGDARQVIRQLDPGAGWDFVFIDAEKTQYLDYWHAVRPRLARGALIVVDNVISHFEKVRPFLDDVAVDPFFDKALVRIGAGLLVIRRTDERLPKLP